MAPKPRVLLACLLALATTTVALSTSATATPPVCIVKEETIGPVEAEVWVTCGPAAEVIVCPPPPSSLPCGRVAVGDHP